MTDKRLTGLALMNIHTDLEIDSEEVLNNLMQLAEGELTCCVALVALCATQIFFLQAPLACITTPNCS